MHEDFKQVGYIFLGEDGRWMVTYVSYVTGEPILQKAIGGKLEALVSGLEKNKTNYLGE